MKCAGRERVGAASTPANVSATGGVVAVTMTPPLPSAGDVAAMWMNDDFGY